LSYAFLFLSIHCFSSFFFNDTATTEIYTLSLHDALPIWWWKPALTWPGTRIARPSCASFPTNLSSRCALPWRAAPSSRKPKCTRSEEHTSELQSRENLVCRLLLEKKKKKNEHTHRKQIR